MAHEYEESPEMIGVAELRTLASLNQDFAALAATVLEHGLPGAWQCPRCGEYTASWPAASRWDDETAICSDCGREEGIHEFLDGTYRQHSALMDPEMSGWKYIDDGIPVMSVDGWSRWAKGGAA